MAPHDTNTKQEARRHKGPLIAMLLIVAAVAIMFFAYVAYATKEPELDEAAPAEEQAVEPTD